MQQNLGIKKKFIPAFTLIEIIVTTTMMAVMALILATSLVQSNSILQTNKIINTFQNDARLTIIKMSKDLRRTNLSQITIQKNTPIAGYDKLIYHLPSVDANNAPIVNSGALQWDANNVVIAIDAANAGRLIRTDANGTATLAKNVNYITFRDINDIPQLALRELKISLGFRTTSFGNRIHNYNSTTVINMRN
jgi:type II secretory pathway pseudopilin PulG